ncbi:MAG: hypothetical protein MJ168_10615 [Clostridia bacterium]|nr:hypothetical protein [Clostridia bacterium]
MKQITGKDIIINSSANLDFSTPPGSYSPMFSTIGLQANSDGIGALWLHYNRATRAVCNKLFDFSLPINNNKSDICGLVFGDKEMNAKLSFFDADAFVLEAGGIENISVFSDALDEYWIENKNENRIDIKGYSKNPDARDPDKKVGYMISFSTQRGKIICNENGIKISAENQKIMVKVFVQILEVSDEKADEILSKNIDWFSAKKECEKWFKKYTENFSLNVQNETEEQIVSTAIFGLMFNSAIGQGDLSHHISAYPNRGGYPTHFIWDTYFQNLAFENISPFLAEEFLLQIIANQRADGKFPQFMCSTWVRPHDTQPALFGWSARRILNIVPDRKAFIEKIADDLEKNNRWWLSQRITKYGCIFCPGGLETGQDDSPRFDNGATLATDMNSYLLDQLRFTAEIFEEIGDKNKADFWKEKADKLEEKIIENLYDKERNIFFDFSLTQNKKVDIVSPSSMMPLWAGVKLGENKEREMIEKYLINPEYMFADVPFPSIAYNEDVYDTAQWWRGPTWLPIAWLMLEILLRFGYNDEYMTAVRKLYDILIKDEDMHELFNSQTGEGMGNLQQGWTCAIFIKFCEILNK